MFVVDVFGDIVFVDYFFYVGEDFFCGCDWWIDLWFEVVVEGMEIVVGVNVGIVMCVLGVVECVLCF